MTTQQWDASGEASAALRAVVQDRGAAALSDPQLMNSLLRDFMPGSPRESSILVAAAEADVASLLRDRAAQQISTASAVAQAAAVLEERTALAASACQWAARQIAEAIGLPPPQGPGPDPRQVPPPAPPPTPTPPMPPPPSWPVPPAPPAPQQIRAPGSAALVAAGAALICALSLSLQVLQSFPLGASYAWFLALSGLTLFGGAVLAFGGKSKYAATGMIFGAALVVVTEFIEESVGSTGATGTLTSVFTTLTALIAAGAAVAYFAREGRLGGINLGNPVAAAFCAAALGYVIAFIPGWEQFADGSTWLTPPGLIGPGVHGKFVFAGIVALAALAIPVVVVGLLAPRTGARTGVLVGWLLVNGASLVSGALTAGQPEIRAGSALYASGILWVIAAILGIALLTSARPQQVGTGR